VNNELDPLGFSDADLEESGGGVRANEHGEVAEVEDSDRVALVHPRVTYSDVI
jgi:hypothetical protein